MAASSVPRMPNDELTFNYNLDCLGNQKTGCCCNAPNCSGFIGVRPMAAAGPEKSLNDKKRKRKKSRLCVIKDWPHDAICFRCGEGGELVMCDPAKSLCPKAYHLQCLNLEKSIYGKLEYPWHHCNVCGKIATQLCSECPSSFCNKDIKGNIFEIDNGRLVCSNHEDLLAVFENLRNDPKIVMNHESSKDLEASASIVDCDYSETKPASLTTECMVIPPVVGDLKTKTKQPSKTTSVAEKASNFESVMSSVVNNSYPIISRILTNSIVTEKVVSNVSMTPATKITDIKQSERVPKEQTPANSGKKGHPRKSNSAAAKVSASGGEGDRDGTLKSDDCKRSKKRKSYDVSYKLMVIEYAEEHSKCRAAKHFGLCESQVRNWKGLKEALLAMKKGGKRVRFRPSEPENPDLEKQLIEWVNDTSKDGIVVTGSRLQMQAKCLALSLGATSFKASNGWLHRFKKRNCSKTGVHSVPVL